MSKKIQEILEEGLRLDEEIKERKVRLAEIKELITPDAKYKPGSMTGWLIGKGIRSKVVKPSEEWSFEQERLQDIRNHMSTRFDDTFKMTYAPHSAAHLKEALKDEEFKQALEWARKKGKDNRKPTVTFERIEEDKEKS